jgi:LPS-assembly lipoprotein
MATRAGRRAVVSLLMAAALPGCGFRPVYLRAADGGAGPAQEGFAAISVALIPERFGQLVRQALQARLDQGGSGVARRYDLLVSPAFSAEALSIQPDNSATRIRLVGSATWALAAQDPRRTTLASGSARSLDGANVLDQQYFALDMEVESVQRRVAEALADQIVLQLASYFNKRAAAAHPTAS